MKSKIQFIKPRKILELSGINKPLKLINPPLEIGSPSVFETLILMNLIAILKSKNLNIFEFGTFQGYTLSSILLNFPNCQVTSIDLPVKVYVEDDKNSKSIFVDGEQNDLYLKKIQNKKDYPYFKYLTEEIKHNVNLIQLDSLNYQPQDFKHTSKFDFIFIDGGHDSKTIENDTKKAFELTSSNSIITWHDYNSSIHKEVTEYLDKLSFDTQLYSVIGTSIVFFVNFNVGL
jgi:predicted O-methyltransferase YrrM